MEVLEAAAMFFLPTPRSMDCAYPWGFFVHTPTGFFLIPLRVSCSYPYGFFLDTPGGLRSGVPRQQKSPSRARGYTQKIFFFLYIGGVGGNFSFFFGRCRFDACSAMFRHWSGVTYEQFMNKL